MKLDKEILKKAKKVNVKELTKKITPKNKHKVKDSKPVGKEFKW